MNEARPSQDHPALHSSFVRESPFIISKAVIRFIGAAFKGKGERRKRTMCVVDRDETSNSRNIGEYRDIGGAILRSISLLKQLRTTMYFMFSNSVSFSEPRLISLYKYIHIYIYVKIYIYISFSLYLSFVYIALQRVNRRGENV